MGWFETYPKWKEVSKEEYEKWESKIVTIEDFILSGFDYKKEPILERKGLLAIMDPNNHIIGYKYYKRVGEEMCYYCGKEEYEYLKGTVAE